MFSIKKMCILSLLTACSCLLSYLDKQLSFFIVSSIPIMATVFPYFKIGLANILVIFVLYLYSFKESLMVVLLKSFICGFIFGGLTSFYIGFLGSIFSFFVMVFLKKLLSKEKYIVFISMVGGFFHVLGQILAIFALYGIKQDNYINFSYFPFLLIFGAISGVIIGIISKRIISIIKIKKGSN